MTRQRREQPKTNQLKIFPAPREAEVVTPTVMEAYLDDFKARFVVPVGNLAPT
jgi:hypothetical protein